jgi:hypothetical protein
MKIKADCLDLNVSRPDSGKIIILSELDPAEYNYFFNHGYQWIFEESVEPIPIRKEEPVLSKDNLVPRVKEEVPIYKRGKRIN